MRNCVYIFVALLAASITGCSEDDPTPAPTEEHPCALVLPPPHAGTWNLISVSKSIAGISHDFEPGTIKWKFEFCPNSGVTVVNNNTNEQVEDFLETGHYEISHTEYNPQAEGCPQYWVIDNTNYGCINHSEENPATLTLTQQVTDGYTLTFTR